jgi:ACS family hexuronate transporter-like MFS transporter
MRAAMAIQVSESRRRWAVLGFAFLATVINYLDRQTLSVMAPVLLAQFHISAGSYSQIIFAFMLAYTLMNGVSGRFLDWIGSKAGYSLIIAWWSAAEILHAFSGGALSLGICRFLLGLGEAGNYPAGVKLVAEWFPIKERSTASGIFNSGASIGAILAPPLLAWIVLSTGWRIAFIVIGTLGFLWLAAWIPFYRRPAAPAARTTQPGLKALIRSRFLWQFTLSKVFSDPVWYFYSFWFPEYLKEVHGLSFKQIGETAWIPFFTAAIGNLAGGAVFSGLMRMGGEAASVRRLAVLVFSALMVPSILVAGDLGTSSCVALISLATFGYTGALANLLAIPGDAFPDGVVASVWGIASMGSGFGAMIFSLITGWIVDHYSFRPTFVLFGLLPIVAACIVWFLPRDAGLGTAFEAEA